jgi:hypothetical protein
MTSRLMRMKMKMNNKKIIFNNTRIINALNSYPTYPTYPIAYPVSSTIKIELDLPPEYDRMSA